MRSSISSSFDLDKSLLHYDRYTVALPRRFLSVVGLSFPHGCARNPKRAGEFGRTQQDWRDKAVISEEGHQ